MIKIEAEPSNDKSTAGMTGLVLHPANPETNMIRPVQLPKDESNAEVTSPTVQLSDPESNIFLSKNEAGPKAQLPKHKSN